MAGTSQIDIAGNLASIGGAPVQTNLGTIIASFLGAAILVGAIAAFGYMVLGGLGWITAGGDTGKIDKARQKILQSIIGLAVLASTFAIFLVVQYFFGISILSTGGSSNIGGLSTGGGATGGGGSSGSLCEIGKKYSDGGSGNYCTTGSATVQCFGAGKGVSKFPYTHFEPCSCDDGRSAERAGVDFSSC